MTLKKQFEQDTGYKITDSTSGNVELWEYIKYLEKKYKELQKQFDEPIYPEIDNFLKKKRATERSQQNLSLDIEQKQGIYLNEK